MKKIRKSEITGMIVYAAVVAVLCLIFRNYTIAVAVLGIMGLIGYLRTRRLESNSEHIGDHNVVK